MTSMTQGNDRSKGDLLVNNLIYRQPQQLSLAVNRTLKRQQFQRSSYEAGETAIIDWNTGSDSVTAPNSYLVFTVKLTGTDPKANFGVGSAINLFDRITITSKSGTDLDRIDKLNLLRAKQLRHRNSQDWIDHYATAIGMGSTGLASSDPDILNATGTKFVIPLNLLSGFFNPTGGHLIPPQIAAGLEISLRFADFRTALVQKTGTVEGYRISGISMMTDCVTLSDDTQKSLNFESAQSGLEFTYPRYHTATSVVSSTAINVQVAKSVAQASTLTATLVRQSDILKVEADSLRSVPWLITSWSARLGNLYFPNEALTDDATDGLESYFITQTVNDKAKYSHAENAVSIADFKDGFGVIMASFERDQSLNLSGCPVNNSRQIELSATLDSFTDGNREITVFLEYSCVAKCYIDNCSVSV